jgi:hypothetical protein
MSSDRFELLKAPAHVAPACSAAVPALGTINQGRVPKYGPQPIENPFGAAVWGADQTVAAGAGHCLFAVGGLLAGRCGALCFRHWTGHDVRVVVGGS